MQGVDNSGEGLRKGVEGARGINDRLSLSACPIV